MAISEKKRAWLKQYTASGRRKEVARSWRKRVEGKFCDCGEAAAYIKSNEPVCERCQRTQEWLEKENINKTRFA